MQKKYIESGNEELKKIALTAFGSYELIGKNKDISAIINETAGVCDAAVKVTDEYLQSIVLNSQLSIVAKYTNDSWVKTSSNNGFFISGISKSGSIKISVHNKVKYNGIVYFKTKEAVQYAIEKIGENWIKDVLTNLNCIENER